MRAPLRSCLVVTLLWLGAVAPAAAQTEMTPFEMSGADRTEIQKIIRSQVDAFLRDDGSAAFSFASPTIRERFRTADNFMDMVKSGYEPVYRPRVFEFREIVQVRGGPAQTAYVVGPDGVPKLAVYPMQRQADGTWRINGCYLLDIPDESV